MTLYANQRELTTSLRTTSSEQFPDQPNRTASQETFDIATPIHSNKRSNIVVFARRDAWFKTNPRITQIKGKDRAREIGRPHNILISLRAPKPVEPAMYPATIVVG